MLFEVYEAGRTNALLASKEIFGVTSASIFSFLEFVGVYTDLSSVGIEVPFDCCVTLWTRSFLCSREICVKTGLGSPCTFLLRVPVHYILP